MLRTGRFKCGIQASRGRIILEVTLFFLTTIATDKSPLQRDAGKGSRLGLGTHKRSRCRKAGRCRRPSAMAAAPSAKSKLFLPPPAADRRHPFPSGSRGIPGEKRRLRPGGKGEYSQERESESRGEQESAREGKEGKEDVGACTRGRGSPGQ